MSIELTVPDLGESVEEVEIGIWHKKPGERVEADEILVELDSDKATLQFPSPTSGILLERRLETGDAAKVGDVLAILDDTAQDGPTQEEPTKEKEPEEELEDRPAGKAAAPVARDARTETGTFAEAQAHARPAHARERPTEVKTAITPSARRLLRQHGYDLDQARQTTGGRIDRASAQTLVEARLTGAGGSGGALRREQRVRMSPLRRTIARRLVEAQQRAALLSTFNEIDMTRVQAVRRTHGETFREVHGVKLGFMSFFVRAAVEALKVFPGLNARVDEDDIVYHDYFDIGVAIGADRGLVVPVLRNAELLGFADVERAIADFAERAQAGRLEPDELAGGTFTISNGGVYGSLLSTPIVNPPQSGVLGLHAIQDRPVGMDGEIQLRPMMYVALTYDHRVVDGREAVGWLAYVKSSIEDPARLLLEV